MAATPPEPPRRNGKLHIPLPFKEAVKAATEVSADKLPPPKRKPQKKRAKR